MEYMCQFFYYLQESKVRKSSSKPLKLVILVECRPLDSALKSSIITVRDRLPHNNASKFNFRFDLNV